ncbi:carbonic anhydrase [Rapidithrix thailandica]|uniref:Carbonic anhydrase n=1 Tax=Rapidithrix thailandica TaxID=413964 RepID=A0AAW9RZT3_9BACT
MDLYQQIFENNRQWVKEKLAQNHDFFEKLAKDQQPEFLYIGCADSRVPANVIMGLEPGEVFVHRNVANLVIGTDANVNAVIQYAVESLKVKYIVVCGHYGCGGVQAAMKSVDMGGLNGWLRNIRDVYRIHEEELDAIENEKERYNRLVELNVEEQCINVIKTSYVQKAYNNEGFPTVHAWVYDLKNGLLKDLQLDFQATLNKVKKLYDLGHR